METGNQYKLVVGVFQTARETKKAIKTLHNHGFPIRQVSVVAKGLDTSGEDRQIVAAKHRILNRILDHKFIEQHFPSLIEHFHVGKLILVATGSADEVARAYGILIDAKAEFINHNLTDSRGLGRKNHGA